MKKTDNDLIICEMRFFEYAKQAPEGSRYKGTVNSESLVGYIEYTERDEANERHQEDSLHDGGYLGYTDKEEKTFSSKGWLNNENNGEFRKELLDSFKQDGDLWWEIIFSLKDFGVAVKYGLNSVDDYQEYIQGNMVGIFNKMGLDPNNMIWWANYHNDTQHPHVHINFMEKEKTRNRGKLQEKKELSKVKLEFAKNLEERHELASTIKENNKQLLKNKDIQYKTLVDTVNRDVLSKPVKGVADLYKILPNTGRLQYGSVHMIPYRKKIDGVVDNILKDKRIQDQLNKYYKSLEKLEWNMNKYFSTDERQAQVSSIVEAEQERLKERIANMILKNYKKKIPVRRDRAKSKDGNYNTKYKPVLKKQFDARRAKKITIRYISQCSFHIQKEMEEWERNNNLFERII